ncbi:hypothetical protein SE15_06370 [Thermanaerothrix daxensis]|uniref:Uncharacterized protein n=1 Tax=Thermanaerothrix daxensis TaxID=869279 RepID=A0A0P6Y5F6_9CHLR|nr:hypothetical protein SE15_06370 [Thermanaerothrix daxensis]
MAVGGIGVAVGWGVLVGKVNVDVAVGGEGLFPLCGGEVGIPIELGTRVRVGARVGVADGVGDGGTKSVWPG